jgi:MATE family multidrug resistance protein
MIWLPLVGTPCYLWDGIFVGLTASRAMRDSMVLALLVFLATWYLATPAWGNHGLWLSLLLFLGVRGVVQGWMYGRGVR